MASLASLLSDGVRQGIHLANCKPFAVHERHPGQQPTHPPISSCGSKMSHLRDGDYNRGSLRFCAPNTAQHPIKIIKFHKAHNKTWQSPASRLKAEENTVLLKSNVPIGITLGLLYASPASFNVSMSGSSSLEGWI